jgi:hypothetical protein
LTAARPPDGGRALTRGFVVSSVLLAHRPAASLYSISLVAALLRVERKKNEMGTRVRRSGSASFPFVRDQRMAVQ